VSAEDDELELDGDLETELGRFALLPEWTIVHRELTDGEFRVYATLRLYANSGRRCFPKARTLAEQLGKSVGSVRNAIQKFRRLELLISVPRYGPNGAQTSNLYRLRDLPPTPQDVGGLHHTMEPPSTARCSQVTEPREQNQRKKISPPPASTHGRRPTTVEEEEIEGIDIGSVLDEVEKLRPGWSVRAVCKVLRDAVAEGRSPDEAKRVLIEHAQGRWDELGGRKTLSPRRILADGPWWAQRAAEPVQRRRISRPPAPPVRTSRSTEAKAAIDATLAKARSNSRKVKT
jgi:GntR family transcriptional regulator